MRMYLSYPVQLKEFGREYFEDTEHGFAYRYQQSKRFFGLMKSIFIPYGPVCNDLKSFSNFLDQIEKNKMTKVYIDLPLILDPKILKEVTKELQQRGYKHHRSEVLDGETILVEKDKYCPNSRSARYIRRGIENFRIEIKSEIAKDEIRVMHELYLSNNTEIRDFNPKPLAAFTKIASHGVTAIAYDKITNKIEGFLMGYIDEIATDFKNNVNKKILYLMFTAATDIGREQKIGFALHGRLFDEAFNNLGVDLVDFLGADRAMNRKYTEFKMKWGGEFVSFPGSYQKTFWL
ncbi:MAG: hypothetical protein WCG48_01695 [Candidatus Berkelbacteria bacterium]